MTGSGSGAAERRAELTGSAVLHHHDGAEKHQDLHFSLQQNQRDRDAIKETIWVGKGAKYGRKNHQEMQTGNGENQDVPGVS